MTPPTDVQIVDASIDRPEEFAELFDRHARTVQGYVARRAPAPIAAELLAATFLTAFEKRDHVLLIHDDALPWLLGLATDHLGNDRRSDARAREIGNFAVDPTSTGLDDDAIQRFLDRDGAESPVEAVTSVIGTLREVDRDALLLYAWEGLTYLELADILDVSLATVRSRLIRARRLLRFALQNTHEGRDGLMDEIAMMRGLRDEFTPPRDDEAIARARHRLVERIEIERAHPVRSTGRRIVVGAALAALVVAVALGLATFLLGGDGDGDEPPHADAAAVEVLTSASDNVENLILPVTRPGEYLLRKRVEVTWGSAGSADGEILAGSDGQPMVWATERVHEVWIPDDPADEWVLRERLRPKHLASKDARSLAGPAADHLVRATRGDFGSRGRFVHPSTAEQRFSSYPREPRELLTYVRSHPAGAGGRDATAFDAIGDLLREGTAPLDLRAAAYRALSLLPQVSLVSDSVELAGRSGVAIGFPDAGELIVDPETGTCIGERTVSPDFPLVPGLGADQVTSSDVVTVRVVDSAPLDEATPLLD